MQLIVNVFAPLAELVEEPLFYRNGKWQSTNSFRVQDLPRVELVARKAYEFLSLKEKSGEDWENNSEEKKEGMESSFPE